MFKRLSRLWPYSLLFCDMVDMGDMVIVQICELDRDDAHHLFTPKHGVDTPERPPLSNCGHSVQLTLWPWECCMRVDEVWCPMPTIFTHTTGLVGLLYTDLVHFCSPNNSYDTSGVLHSPLLSLLLSLSPSVSLSLSLLLSLCLSLALSNPPVSLAVSVCLERRETC